MNVVNIQKFGEDAVTKTPRIGKVRTKEDIAITFKDGTEIHID